MKSLALFLTVLMSSHGADALTQDEQTQIMAADKARWETIKIGNYSHAQPPAGWKLAHAPNARASLSFPCEPKIEAGKTITYACAVGKISYSAILEDGDFRGPNQFQFFSAGTAHQMHKRLLASFGPPVSITPIIGVNYSGVPGRQFIVISSGVTIESRVLCRPDMCVVLSVGAATGKLPKDTDLFFNALQFDR